MKMLTLTQEGTKKLQEEIQRLIKQKRESRSTLEKAFIDERIEEFEKLLSISGLYPIKREAEEVVQAGSTITLEDVTFNERNTYTIVHPYEADPRENKISIRSPIAAASLGKIKTSTITIEVPTGEPLTYKLIDIQNC